MKGNNHFTSGCTVKVSNGHICICFFPRSPAASRLKNEELSQWTFLVPPMSKPFSVWRSETQMCNLMFLFVKFSCKYRQIMNKWSFRVYYFPFTLKTNYEIAKICIDKKTVDGLILVFIFRARGCFKRTKTILLKTSFLFLGKRDGSGKN